MGAKKTKISRPPFCCSWIWSIDNKFLSLHVKSCSGRKSCNIRSMTYLGLSIASNYGHFPNFWHPFFLLLIIHHCLTGIHKHCLMQCNWTISKLSIRPMYQMRFMVYKPFIFSILISKMSSFHQIFHLFLSCHVVKLMGWL